MPHTSTISFFNSNPSWGGGEKWHFDIGRRLRERGHHVVFFVHRGGELEQKVRENDFPYESVEISNYSFINPVKSGRIKKLFEKHQVTSVILNLPSDVKIAGVAAKRAGIKKIIYRRGTALPVHNNFFNRLLFQRVITHVVTNSRETRNLLLRRNPRMVDTGKIHVIYNGIDFRDFDQLPAIPAFNHTGEELILGNAGRFVEQKGHRFLLQVARNLKEKNIPFKILLAGEGKLKEKIRWQVRREGLEGHFHFAGFMEDIKGFMESIDLFLLTSLWEGFGYVIVEAMASRKPVVAFNISSNPEIIDDGQNGFLVPFGDTDRFTDRIIRLYENPGLREEMGQNARRFAEQHFNIDRTVNEIEKLLEE